MTIFISSDGRELYHEKCLDPQLPTLEFATLDESGVEEGDFCSVCGEEFEWAEGDPAQLKLFEKEV